MPQHDRRHGTPPGSPPAASSAAPVVVQAAGQAGGGAAGGRKGEALGATAQRRQVGARFSLGATSPQLGHAHHQAREEAAMRRTTSSPPASSSSSRGTLDGPGTPMMTAVSSMGHQGFKLNTNARGLRDMLDSPKNGARGGRPRQTAVHHGGHSAPMSPVGKLGERTRQPVQQQQQHMPAQLQMSSSGEGRRGDGHGHGHGQHGRMAPAPGLVATEGPGQVKAHSMLLSRRSAQAGSRPQLAVDTSIAAGQRGIKSCKRFSDYYELGKTVMPSCHRDMEIRFAARVLRDKSGRGGREEVVVKIRRKPGSFGTSEEEQAWRQNTELVMNLPACSAIARVEEVLEDSSGYFVVMEKVDGLDLHETIHKQGPMPLDDVKDVLRQLLQAVDALHANGCIHKDLKLENIMLDRHQRAAAAAAVTASQPLSPGGALARTPGKLKLVDFDTVEDWCPKSPKATRVLGTDQYISPEAYEGRYSPASDVFAIGVIAYRLLTGSFPFKEGIFDDKPGENWVGSPKMREIRDRLTAVRLDWQKPGMLALPQQERACAQRLIARMLAINELHRPSAREALLDPWFHMDRPLSPQAARAERRRMSLPAEFREKTSGGVSSASTSCSSLASPKVGAAAAAGGGLAWAGRMVRRAAAGTE